MNIEGVRDFAELIESIRRLKKSLEDSDSSVSGTHISFVETDSLSIRVENERLDNTDQRLVQGSRLLKKGYFSSSTGQLTSYHYWILCPLTRLLKAICLRSDGVYTTLCWDVGS